MQRQVGCVKMSEVRLVRRQREFSQRVFFGYYTNCVQITPDTRCVYGGRLQFGNMEALYIIQQQAGELHGI